MLFFPSIVQSVPQRLISSRAPPYVGLDVPCWALPGGNMATCMCVTVKTVFYHMSVRKIHASVA